MVRSMKFIKWLVAISLITISLIGLYLKINQDSGYYQIQTKDLVSSNSQIGVWQIFSHPASTGEACFLDTPKTISLKFARPTVLNGFSIFFPGTDSSMSFNPSSFDVYYVDNQNIRRLWVSRDNYRESFFKYVSPDSHVVSSFELAVKEPSLDSIGRPQAVCLQDLKFYRRIEEGQFSLLLKDLLTQQGLVNYWVYYFIFLALIVIPGYAFLHLTSRLLAKRLDPESLLIFSPIFSFVLLVIFGTVRLISGAQWFYGFYWLLFLASFFYLLLSKAYRDLKSQKAIVAIWFITIIVIFFPIARRDLLFNMPVIGEYLDSRSSLPFEGYMGYFIDSRLPWGFGRVYYNRYALNSPEVKLLTQDTPVFDKPPFLPLAVTIVIGLFGEGHFLYQRFLEILASLYYVSFYVVIKKIFSGRIAFAASLMMLLNVQLSQMPINIEVYYKYFTLYPVLLSLLLLLGPRKGPTLAIGLLLGTAFLIHPLTLIYSLTILILYFLTNRNLIEVARKTLPITLILGILVGLWYFFPKLSGLDKLSTRDSSYYFNEVTKTDSNLIQNKSLILISLFIPNVLLKGGKDVVLSPLSDDYLQQFFRFSLFANLTPVILILFVYYFFKDNRKNWSIAFLSVAPLLIYWLGYLHRYDRWYSYGSTFFLLFPFVVPLAISYVLARLSQVTNGLRLVVLVSYLAFMAVALRHLSGLFSVYNSRLLSVDIFTVLIIILFVGLSVILIKTSLMPNGQKGPGRDNVKDS
ncbi:MAG: hypothetical protein UW69_C0001G0003 [Microgenomates group bacterium GW2011_GWA2_44_7]|nr:MAG: hypothetical protein UW69_C0001G0003 [Microgenomates group bacterium GW2011_GWA2_44_7]KKT78386.1 MAG: hypothetical protein UW73_C0003G0034 [Microgenomates group bacterium GW2011_GWB1_44_8]